MDVFRFGKAIGCFEGFRVLRKPSVLGRGASGSHGASTDEEEDRSAGRASGASSDRLLRQTVYAAVLVRAGGRGPRLSWFGRPPVHVYVAYVLTEPVDVEDVLARLQNWARRWLPEESVWPWRG